MIGPVPKGARDGCDASVELRLCAVGPRDVWLTGKGLEITFRQLFMALLGHPDTMKMSGLAHSPWER